MISGEEEVGGKAENGITKEGTMRWMRDCRFPDWKARWQTVKLF
jgi:hypothetical protein